MDTVPREDIFSNPLFIDSKKQNIPSVSELTRLIKQNIDGAFQNVWVRGEVTNYRKPNSGHAYFIIKDNSSQIRACMFKPQLAKVKSTIMDGHEFVFHGRVTVYETRGEYQIIVDSIEPIGQGALQIAFQALKEKLLKEGLFDPKLKKKLPFLPRRIGLVTSQTGAALQDILKVINNRFANREIVIFPTSVQGDKAALEIAQALQRCEQWHKTSPIDVIILGRGGGSLEDLWCFNEEIVARAIFQCSIPIVSAVGHEIDFTISDFVADLRAPTPSAAAEMILPRKDDLIATIQQLEDRIQRTFQRRLEYLKVHIDHLMQRCGSPQALLERLREKISHFKETLVILIQRNISEIQRKLELFDKLLFSLSPESTLVRGFVLIKKNTTLIHSKKLLAPNDTLTLEFHDGNVTATVNTI